MTDTDKLEQEPRSGLSDLTVKLGVELPPEGYRLAGWLYLNDDGFGPFFSEREQKRYLDEWPVFVRIDTPNVKLTGSALFRSPG